MIVGWTSCSIRDSASLRSSPARTTALVVPSPNSSSCVFATSTSIFAVGCSISISLRIVTPSFVIVTSPRESTSILSMPFGPRVDLTASATARAAAMLLYTAPFPFSRSVPSFKIMIGWPPIMRIPAGLYEGFYMSVLQATDRLGPLPSPVAKAKAGPPMVRRGLCPLPILHRDQGTRQGLPRPVRPTRDGVDLPPMRLALAVPLREVRQRPEFSRHRVLPANQAPVLSRLRAGVPDGAQTVLGLGLPLPDALSVGVRVARRLGPPRVRRPASVAARLLLEAREVRHEPTGRLRG